MIESGYSIGLAPAAVYDMTLWEFNACCVAFNKREKQRQDEIVIQSWQTANFANAAIAGKLKSLKSYLNIEASSVKAPKISDERQKELDRKLAEKRGG